MLISFLFYGIAFVAGLFIIRKETPLYIAPLLIMMLSFLGHILGTYYYSLGRSDSTIQYFPWATPYFSQLGTSFVKNLVWYVRAYLTGDSVIATFYFFSSFAFIGGVFWYVLYLRCAKRLNISGGQLAWPAFILMCWPSALIFTAGMGKDSLSYLFIPLVFLSYFNILEKKLLLWNSLILAISLAMLIALRPYLLMIFFIAYFFYASKELRSMTIKNTFSWIIILIMAVSTALWVLIMQGHFQVIDLISITEKSAKQQDLLSEGTHFYMPSGNPIVNLLLLPYSFIMNLCFPLIYLAKNTMGYAASIENFLLAVLLWKTIRLKKVVTYFFFQDRKIRLLLYFFIVGMLFMSVLNTNLGLAIRQKDMYLPGFLVIYCLLYAKIRGRLRAKY